MSEQNINVSSNGFSPVVSVENILVGEDVQLSTSNITPSEEKNKDISEFTYLRHAVKLAPGVSKNDLRSAFKMNRHDWKRFKGLNRLLEDISAGWIHQAEITIKGEKYYHFGVIDFDFLNKAINAPIEHTITIEQIKQLPSVRKYCLFFQKSISYRNDAQNCHGYVIFNRVIEGKEEFQKCLKALVELIRQDIAKLLNLEYNSKLELGVDGCTANNPAQVTFASLEPVEGVVGNITDGAIASVETLLKLAAFYDVKVSASAKSGRKAHSDEINVPTVTPVKKSPLMEAAALDSRVTLKDDAPGVTKDGLKITDKVLKFLHDNLFLTVFNGDAGLLYSLHDENQRWTPRTDLEVGEVCRLEGNNPFSGTNNSGSSFMVIYVENELPRFWDKSGSFERILKDGCSSNHGTFLDYFFHVQKTRGEYQNVEVEKNGQFPGGFFRQLVDDICEYFCIGFFNWDEGKISLDELRLIVKRQFERKVIYISKDCYFCFSNYRWQIYTDSKRVYGAVIKPWILENYSHIEVYQKKGKKQITIALDLIPFNEFMSIISQSSSEFLNEIGEDGELPSDLTRYVPLNNGKYLYDIVDKELIENDGRAFNRHVIPWEYSPESENTQEVINRLKKYLTGIVNCEVAGEILFIWLMLNCRRQCAATTFGLLLFGKSGRGKTTYLAFIQKLLNGIKFEPETNRNKARSKGYAITPNKNGLLNKDPHAMAALEHKTSVLLPEITKNASESDALDFFKDYLGNDSMQSVTINQKFQESRTVDHSFGFTFDNEKMVRLNSETEGNFRRVIFVEVPETSLGLPEYHAEHVPYLDQNLEVIFNYALTLNYEELKNRLTELKKHPVITQHVKNVRQSNDSLLAFIEDYLVITNDENHKLSHEAIYKVFESVNGIGKYANNKTTKKTLVKYIVERLRDSMYNLNWKGIESDKTVKCKYLGDRKTPRNYLTGLVLNSDACLAIGRHDLALIEIEGTAQPVTKHEKEQRTSLEAFEKTE